MNIQRFLERNKLMILMWDHERIAVEAHKAGMEEARKAMRCKTCAYLKPSIDRPDEKFCHSNKANFYLAFGPSIEKSADFGCIHHEEMKLKQRKIFRRPIRFH